MQRKACIALVLGSVFLLCPVVAQQPPAISENDVLTHLHRTIAWYQTLMGLDEGAATSDTVLARNSARDSAKRALQSSFAFARAQAAILAAKGGTDATSSASTLQQSLIKATARVTHLQDRLQSLDARIEHATGVQRESLANERTAIAADLALAKQLETAVKTMTSFTAPRAKGHADLLDEISRLEALNPVNTAQDAKDKPTSDVSIFHPESAGIVVLASQAFSSRSTIGHIASVEEETNRLLERVDALRAPLRNDVRAIVAESDTISNSEDTAVQPSEWLNTGKQISDLSGRFKQLATTVIPLGETAMSMQAAHGALDEWRKKLNGEYSLTLRYFGIRLGVLVGGALFIFLASAVWQHAIFRYVTEPRRRRQLLLVKRVVVGVLLTLLGTFGFFSSLGSMATLLGFVTAGLALALQNVILSAVAYFFLIGRYGLRVGDRITVQGVTGEVIEVGLIRLFLMELSGTGAELHPTGRLAVFANSVIFQPAALMKQAPGLDYAWHELSVTLEDSGDYQQARSRLTAAATTVYEEYRQALDEQHKAFEQTTHVESARPAPNSRVQFGAHGLEVTIRYPVSFSEQQGHVDEQIVDRIVAEAEKEPKLKFVAGGSPKVSQVI